MMGVEFIRKILLNVLLGGCVILRNKIHIQSIQEWMFLMEWLNSNVVQCLEVLHYSRIVSFYKVQQEQWDLMELWHFPKLLMLPHLNIPLNMLMKQSLILWLISIEDPLWGEWNHPNSLEWAVIWSMLTQWMLFRVHK